MRSSETTMAVRSLCAAVAILPLAAGCSSPTRTEFTTFAQAGSSYAAAVDRLLVAAGAAQVDSTSWTLTVEKETTGMDDETYAVRSQEDLSRLAQIARLRRHARLLGQYFGLLESLATSNAPDRTRQTIDGLVTRLAKVGDELVPPSMAATMPSLAKVGVDLKIRSALKDELDQRQEVIRSQLAIQERLLAALADQVGHALSLSRQSQEQILVVEPILSGTTLRNAETWVSTRRRVLLASLTVDELEAASTAAAKLREVFEGIVAGETTIGRINALMADVASLLSVAEAIES